MGVRLPLHRLVGVCRLPNLRRLPKLHFQSTLSHPSHTSWQIALSYAWWHAEIGANLAANASLSERTVLYIRTHHEPHGPAAELHRVDEVS